VKPAVLIVALAAALAAQQTQLDKATVEGSVVKAAAGEPIRKARVALQRDNRPGFDVLTDAEGHFLISEIQPGAYRLSVERNGFVRQEYGQRTPSSTRPGAPLTLQPGQHLRDIVFRLIPTAVIAGRVLDEDNEPVPNVRVQALRYTYAEGRRQLTQAAATATNDLGEYRLHGLAPGRYYVAATFFPSPQLSGSPAEGTASAYYPGTTDPSSASPVEAAASAELRGVDIRLQIVRMVTVRGRAVLSNGRPARATVRLMRREGAVFAFGGDGIARLRPQGFFELPGVRPGSYFLIAEYGEDGVRYATTVSVEVGSADIGNLDLVLTPGFDVFGHIRVEGSVDVGRLAVSLQPGKPSPAGGDQALVKPDGSFLLEGLARETYRLSVPAVPEDLYLKSARLGDQDVLDAGLDLTQAESAAGPLEIVLSANAARVEGVVRDAKNQPVAGAQVALVPDSRRRKQLQLYKTATSDQNGRFLLRGIAPGEYKLFAWEDIDPGAAQDPEFLRAFESRGESCKVQPGDEQNVQLKLIPAEDTVDR
jgi:protocatechuate 3,4-dioxygenase beta subunit